MSYGHRPKSNFCAILLFLWIAVSARIIALVLQLYEQNKLKLKLSETVQQQIRSKLITKICYTLSVIKTYTLHLCLTAASFPFFCATL